MKFFTDQRVKAGVRCIVLLIIGGVIGYLLSVPGPASGGGQYQHSPNGKWVASADTLDDGPILGPHRTYSELVIQTAPPSSRTLRKMRIQDTALPPIDWRGEGTITWASNNSTVTFKGAARQTSVEITLPIEP